MIKVPSLIQRLIECHSEMIQLNISIMIFLFTRFMPSSKQNYRQRFIPFNNCSLSSRLLNAHDDWFEVQAKCFNGTNISENRTRKFDFKNIFLKVGVIGTRFKQIFNFSFCIKIPFFANLQKDSDQVQSFGNFTTFNLTNRPKVKPLVKMFTFHENNLTEIANFATYPPPLNQTQLANLFHYKPVYRIYTVLVCSNRIISKPPILSIYFQNRPYIIYNSLAPKRYTGFCIDIIDEIAKRLDFEYEIFEEKSFGKLEDFNNGSWGGVMRRLLDGDADIGLGTMSVLGEREAVIDFTVQFHDLIGISIMMRVQLQKFHFFQFLKVFEVDVWLSMMAAFCLTRFLWNIRELY